MKIDEIVSGIMDFLNHPKQCVLVIYGEEQESFALLHQKIKQVTTVFFTFDAQAYDIENDLLTVPITQPIAIMLTNCKLENYYNKYQLNRWTTKLILWCNPLLLHPTLDPSIYFAPIYNNTLKKQLIRTLRTVPSTHTSYRDHKFVQRSSATSQAQPTANAKFENHYLNKKPMASDSLMMQMLADRVLHDLSFKSFLFALIYASRHVMTLKTAVANALTILNYAKCDFSGLDFSHIQAPQCDLSEAIFDKTICKDSDFSGSNFTDAYLSHADFTRANLQNIRIDEIPPIFIFFERNKEGIAIGRILAMALSQDKSTLFVVCDDAVQLRIYDMVKKCFIQSIQWPTDDHKTLLKEINHREQVNLSISNNQQWLAIGLLDTAVIYGLQKENGVLIIKNTEQAYRVTFNNGWYKVAFDQHDTLIVAGDNFLCCVNFLPELDIKHYQTTTLTQLTAMLLLDNNHVIIGNTNGVIQIHCLANEQTFLENAVSKDRIKELDYDERKQLLAISFNNGGVSLYHAHIMTESIPRLEHLKTLDRKISRFKFHPTAKDLAVVFTFDDMEILSLESYLTELLVHFQRPVVQFLTAQLPQPFIIGATTTGMIKFFSLQKPFIHKYHPSEPAFNAYLQAELVNENLEVESADRQFLFSFKCTFNYRGPYYFIDAIFRSNNITSRLLISHEFIRSFALSPDGQILLTISNGTQLWRLDYHSDHTVSAFLIQRKHAYLEACDTVLHDTTLSTENELLLRRYGAQTDFYRTTNKALFFAASNQTPTEETFEKTHDALRGITTCAVM